MFENDYIQRQIEIITRSLAAAIFHKDISMGMAEESVFSESFTISGEDMLIFMLTKYMNERKLNEAENYLFRALEENPSDNVLSIGFDFYENLKSLDDDILAACNFSREEIEQGIADMNGFL